MKLLAALLCLLLLTGCGKKQPDLPETTAAPEQTLHAVGHTLERQTSGLMEVYQTGITGSCSLSAFGDRLILSENGTLTLYEGTFLRQTGQAAAEAILGNDGASLWVYDRNTREVRQLDQTLTGRLLLSLPEDAVGLPALSADGKDCYYLGRDALYLWEQSTGCCRVLRDNIAVQDGSVRCLEDGKTLLLHLTDPNGEENTQLISASDGSAIREDLSPICASSMENTLAIVSSSGSFRRILLLSDAPMRLQTQAEEAFVSFLSPICGAVTERDTEAGLEVKLYLLSTGLCRSTVALPDIDKVTDCVVTDSGAVYLLAHSSAENQWLILRWHYDAFPPEEGSSFLVPYSDTVTAQERFASEERVHKLEKQYGLNIRVFQDAASVMPWDYTLTASQAADETDWTLENLEKLFSLFPEGFLSRLQEGWDGFSLCLGNSIQGTAASGSLAAAQGLQFQEDGRYYVVLALAPMEELRYTLFHEFSHLIDTQVMQRCSAYDNWQDLNPQEFAYSLDVNADMSQYEQYLAGTNRCFVDDYAMTTPAEDRARIFECAANPGNADLFTPPLMQQKLRRICTGIRNAFDLEDDPTRYIWEQYLIQYSTTP